MQAQSPEKSLNVIKVIVFERRWSCCLTSLVSTVLLLSFFLPLFTVLTCLTARAREEWEGWHTSPRDARQDRQKLSP